MNPKFGTTADVQRFVDAAHAVGLKVLLDWVPNHTAYDHPWITQHPDWYEHIPDGSIHNARDNEGHATDWTDVAELNYSNPEMCGAMLADMRYWLDTMRVDGFRCDVAGGVPEDFWREARCALGASRPGFFMLAEAEGKKGAPALDAYFAASDSAYPRDAYRMDFTSNHDENSWNGSEFERMGANHLPSYVLAATASQGMPLLYTGQEVSLNKRLRFFERDTVNWNGPSLAPWYRRVFDLKHSQPALRNGSAGGPQVRLATDGGERVYAYTRTRGANTVLVAVNFGDAPATVRYTGLARPGAYRDWFDRTRLTLGVEGSVQVPAHGYRVLVK